MFNFNVLTFKSVYTLTEIANYNLCVLLLLYHKFMQKWSHLLVPVNREQTYSMLAKIKKMNGFAAQF